MKFISFAAGLVAMATQAYALFDEVETLTTENFEEMVLNDDENMWIVAFYAEWCPYCKPFDPEYAAAKADPKMADKRVKFAAIDVMANRETTQKYGINRSPTVKIFGKDKSAPIDYENARKKTEMVSYLNDYAITNDFIVEAAKAEYLYNIDAIIKTISQDHDIRVAEVEKKHQQELVDLAKDLEKQTGETKKQFEGKLEELREVGEDMIANAAIEVEDQVELKKSSQKQELDQLDWERRETIQNIEVHDRQNVELSDYINTIDQDWFKIEWSDDNQLPKSCYHGLSSRDHVERCHEYHDQLLEDKQQKKDSKEQGQAQQESLFMQPYTSYQQPQSIYQQPQSSYQPQQPKSSYQPQSYKYQQQQTQQPSTYQRHAPIYNQKIAQVPVVKSYGGRKVYTTKASPYPGQETAPYVFAQSQKKPKQSQYGARPQWSQPTSDRPNAQMAPRKAPQMPYQKPATQSPQWLQQSYSQQPQQQKQPQQKPSYSRPPQQRQPQKQQKPQYSSNGLSKQQREEQYERHLAAKVAATHRARAAAAAKTQQNGSRLPARAAPRPTGAYY